MASNVPFRTPGIPTVRIKRHWWEILWINIILGIFVVVAGGIILERISHRGKQQPPEVRQPSLGNSETNGATKQSSSGSPIDVIPKQQEEQKLSGDNGLMTVYAGQEVKVICMPRWVASVEYLDPYK